MGSEFFNEIVKISNNFDNNGDVKRIRENITIAAERGLRYILTDDLSPYNQIKFYILFKEEGFNVTQHSILENNIRTYWLQIKW